METNETFAAISDTFTGMVNSLSLFTPQEVNTIPFTDSWTAGQVTQHVIMSVSGFNELLNGPTQETDREPDLHVEELRTLFLNFDIKMKSPDFILPPAIDYDKKELLRNLEHLKNQLNQFDLSQDMTKTCTGFALPVMGYLTRVEAATFILVHTQRHVHQLENIYHTINN